MECDGPLSHPAPTIDPIANERGKSARNNEHKEPEEEAVAFETGALVTGPAIELIAAFTSRVRYTPVWRTIIPEIVISAT